MAICPKYADLRYRFAAPGAPLDADGFLAFPGPLNATGSYDNAAPTYLRAGGFTSTWKVTTQGGTIWSPATTGPIGPLIGGTVPGGDLLFPLTVTIDNHASDGGTSAYDWYLMQGSDGLRYVLADGTLSPTGQPQYFNIAHPDTTHSGTVVITTQSAQIAALFPGSGGVCPTDAASLAVLFCNCALYVSRVSDRAYQWARFVPA